MQDARSNDRLSAQGVAQKVGAEMVGTFALVFAACGAIMVNDVSGGSITHVGVGIVFGLVIMVMIYATGRVSVQPKNARAA